MLGFEAKKGLFCVYPSLILRTASALRNLPLHTFAPPARIEPGCDNWKPNTVTTTLCNLHQCDDKMSYLNQMYEKGNDSIRKEKKISRMFHSPSHLFLILQNILHKYFC